MVAFKMQGQYVILFFYDSKEREIVMNYTYAPGEE